MSAKTRRIMSRKRNSARCYNATYHGLHKWYVAMFEKLGWMVLAKCKGGMELKIAAYKESIQHLKRELECKLDAVSEHDRKLDLKIMHENVCVLADHAAKDL